MLAEIGAVARALWPSNAERRGPELYGKSATERALARCSGSATCGARARLHGFRAGLARPRDRGDDPRRAPARRGSSVRRGRGTGDRRAARRGRPSRDARARASRRFIPARADPLAPSSVRRRARSGDQSLRVAAQAARVHGREPGNRRARSTEPPRGARTRRERAARQAWGRRGARAGARGARARALRWRDGWELPRARRSLRAT
jgi:hypothetical protein